MKLRNKVKYECDFNYICIVNLINLIFIIKYLNIVYVIIVKLWRWLNCYIKIVLVIFNGNEVNLFCYIMLIKVYLIFFLFLSIFVNLI